MGAFNAPPPPASRGWRSTPANAGLSSLLALRSFYPSHPLVQDIIARLATLSHAGKSIQFCWIPSHVGIVGNELVDAAARRAASASCTRRLPLPARDFYPAAGSFVHSQ